MQQQDRVRVKQLIQLLDELKAFDPHMPVVKAVAFLHIAAAPGMGVTQLANVSGTTVASASRHVQALGRQVSPGGAPLVVTGYGVDARTKALLLTEDGRRLINRVTEVLDRLATPGRA